MDARLNPDKNARVQLDQPSKLPYSDEQKAAVRAVFGSDQVPFVKRLPGAGPRTSYTLTLPAHHYPLASGEASWNEVSTQIALDAAARNMTSSGTWPALNVSGSFGKIAAQGMAFKGTQTRDVSGLWLGDTSVTIANMTIAPPAAGPGLQIEDTTYRASVTREGKKLHHQQDMLSKRILVAGERIDNFHLAYRIRNLDVDAMAKLKADAVKLQNTEAVPAANTAATLKQLQSFFRSIAMTGAVLELDDFSASYKGNTARVKGSVSMPAAKVDDASTLEMILKKLVVRLEVRVPLALLRDITQTIARKSPASQGQAAQPPAAIEHMAQTMYDAALGKLMANGYAKIEKDELRTTVDVRNGDIRINGKRLPTMGKPAQATQPVPATEAVPAQQQPAQ